VVLHEVTVEGVHSGWRLQHGQLEHSLLLLLKQSSCVQLEQLSLSTDSEVGDAAGVSTPKTVGAVEFSNLLNCWPCATTTNPTKGHRLEAQIIAGYRVAEQTCRNE
jgi:hypothetical protein